MAGLISEDDLVRLAAWIKTTPEVPEGEWCKDFGTFTLAGEGNSVADTMIRTRSTVLGKAVVEILSSEDRNGIMTVRTTMRVCYVWAKDLAAVR